MLGRHPVRATLIAGLVGLVPNCGASVVICELYLAGSLATGPMLAGLLVSGGVGLLVLFRTNDDLRQNLLVTAFVYAVGVLVGLLFGIAGIIIWRDAIRGGADEEGSWRGVRSSTAVTFRRRAPFALSWPCLRWSSWQC